MDVASFPRSYLAITEPLASSQYLEDHISQPLVVLFFPFGA